MNNCYRFLRNHAEFLWNIFQHQFLHFFWQLLGGFPTFSIIFTFYLEVFGYSQLKFSSSFARDLQQMTSFSLRWEQNKCENYNSCLWWDLFGIATWILLCNQSVSPSYTRFVIPAEHSIESELFSIKFPSIILLRSNFRHQKRAYSRHISADNRCRSSCRVNLTKFGAKTIK